MRSWLACLLLQASLLLHAAGAGPPGGLVTSIAVDPQNPATVYASTHNGAFKSTNGGERWVEILFEGYSRVFAVSVDPSDSNTLYASSDRLLRSTDAGATWIELGHIDGRARFIAVDPRDSNILYAATYSGRGVFKSADRGATWVAANNGMPTGSPATDIHDVTGFELDQAGNLYVSVARGGIYRSSDGARNWRRTAGLPDTPISAMAVHPTDSSVIYAAAYCGGPMAPGFRCDGGIYRSTDGGVSWHDVSTGLQSRDVTHLRFAPSDASVLYASTSAGWVYRASPDGASWIALHDGGYPGLSLAGVPAFAVSPDDASVLYVGTLGGGVYKSSDGGRNWRKTNSGLTGIPVNALAMGDALYAGTAGGGVFRTDDGGRSWKSAANGLTNTFVRAMAVHPNRRIAYAGTEQGGVFRSTDGGETWTSASNGLPNATAAAIAIDPADPATVFVGFSPYDNTGGLFRTTDSGATWTTLSTTPVASLVMLPDKLYTLTGPGILQRSTDRGATWTAVTVQSGYDIYDLAHDPANPTVLYTTGTESCWCDAPPHLFKSTDAGETWSDVATITEIFGRLVVRGTVLYSAGVGVMKSTDGGLTWTQSGLQNTLVSTVAVDPANPSVLYAATGRGVYRSADGGATWQPTAAE